MIDNTLPITVYLALGSNLGDRRANLMDAISRLRYQITITQTSAVYETEPAYVTGQPRFYNMVLGGNTHLKPHHLLRFLHSIERGMGRERILRNGPRPIDLDILAYGDVILNDPELTIPHPQLAERAFVLAPLAEIAPDLVLPGQLYTVGQLFHQLGDGGQGKIVDVLQKPGLPASRDVQDEPPAARLSLTHVGVSNVKRIIRLKGVERDNLVYAEMDIYVELKPDKKGAHMSRFSDTVEEIVDEINNTSAGTLETFAERIAQKVLVTQRATRSDVRIRAQFPQRRYAPVSGKPTQEIYTLIGIAAATDQGTARLVGVEAEGMMACPCAQEMVANQSRGQLKEAGFTPAQIDQVLQIVPVATHNQRGRGTLIVGTCQPLNAEDLVRIVEGAMSSENYDLLKRPDELFVVTKAHRYPRFVEDAVREMMVGLLEWYPHLPDDTFVLARQLNMETIHKHDVYAERMGTLGELRGELNPDVPDGILTHTTMEAWLADQLGDRI